MNPVFLSFFHLLLNGFVLLIAKDSPLLLNWFVVRVNIQLMYHEVGINTRHVLMRLSKNIRIFFQNFFKGNL